MYELFGIFSSVENAQMITLLVLGVLGLIWSGFVWENAKSMHKHVTMPQWIQIYGSAGVTLFCGMILLGMFIAPENADALLDLLYLRDPLLWITHHIQSVVLWMLRVLM